MYQNIIPPAKISERTHESNAGGPYKRVNIIPDETPMLLDRTWSTPNRTDFTKENCRHFNAAKGVPYAVNAVYMDGHVYGRGAEEIAVLRDCISYGQQWF